MLSLRRTALRVLSSSPSVSISIPASKARCITRLSYPLSFVKPQKTSVLAFQRRHYADEPTSQSEPEAFGATEAEHGENSIAASTDSDADANASAPVEHAEERAADSKVESAADSVRSATQSVRESVTGAAQGLSSAAGFGSQGSEAGTAPPAEEESTTVYVGNLFFDVKAEDLEREFGKAGPVVSAKVIMDPRGLSKGFGYVTFESIEASQRAIQLFNLQNFEGRRLSVQFSISRPSSPKRPDRLQRLGNTPDRPNNGPTSTLFIGNMSFDMSDRDLNNLFRDIKDVVDVRVAIDRRTGQPRGFAHADFADVASAEKAMKELTGKVVSGRPLRIDFSTSVGRGTVGNSV